ncbi:unnamed protein product [Meganyctiphanes norvegica]|uniref:Peptidase S1 domain-containing protein n=1 Tax=Meganyctiphanes norvegica TaxID=48144 RepID=A0AAV2R5P3_MEGNR
MDRSQIFVECASNIKQKFSECLSTCIDLACPLQELINYKSACKSGIIQTCTTLSTPTPTTMATTVPPMDPVKCGIESKAPTRIVNGVDVNVARKYSWQVGLKDSKQEAEKYFCGGTIITDKHILTAAHCMFIGGCPVKEAKRKVIFVGIGDHRQEQTTDNHPDFLEPVRSIKITPHPEYSCATVENDVAIIELSRPIDLLKHADFIHPICLPNDDSKTYRGLTATVTGWGSLVGYDPSDLLLPPPPVLPNILQEAQVSIQPNSKCKRQYKNILESIPVTAENRPKDIKDSMICTRNNGGFDGGGKGPCMGDSGGPLTVKEDGKHVQVGQVSFGLGCASKGSPAIYQRTSKFLRWIKVQVGAETIYTLS